ncbi:12979_t:CDS:2, partial [Acaulospora colombiana]
MGEKRSQRQINIHQPNITAGTAVNGGTVENVNGEVKLMPKKRDNNEQKKQSKKVAIKNKESVASASNKTDDDKDLEYIPESNVSTSGSKKRKKSSKGVEE